MSTSHEFSECFLTNSTPNPKLLQSGANGHLFSNISLDYIRERTAFNGSVVIIDGSNLTLSPLFLDHRSEVITTYALCGFANLGSIGIILGALTAMAPQRTADLSAVVLRAMITANFACFMTACVAGLLYGGGDDRMDESVCSESWMA